jgi:hypothetical protein
MIWVLAIIAVMVIVAVVVIVADAFVGDEIDEMERRDE